MLHDLVYKNTFNPSQIEEAARHIELSSKHKWPRMGSTGLERKGICAIVGSSPSVKEHLERIREISETPGNEVFALSAAHDWLIENGITPHGRVLFEVGINNRKMLWKPKWGCTYYISAMCHPEQFKRLEGYDSVIWFPWSDQKEHIDAYIENYGNPPMIGGGATTFSRTLFINIVRGFRNFEMFGLESSFPESDSHFNGTPTGVGDTLEVIAMGDGKARSFNTKFYLARQADEFRRTCKAYGHLFNAKFHGDGLMPYIHKTLYPEIYKEH